MNAPKESLYREVRRRDVVVLGGGVAGLTVALECAPRAVTVLSKQPFSARDAGGCSPWAQGGVAAAVGEGDAPAFHAADTVAAGAGLTDGQLALALTSEAPERIHRLLALGARFDRDDRGELALGQEAAHGHRRILHARDATGAEVVRALAAAVAAAEHVETVSETEALALLVEQGRIVGVVAEDPQGERILYRTPAVVLATGGLGQLYLHSTNPPESTGDGLALAARAGARLVDLEFVQFHPTALAVPATAEGASLTALPLLTEALRGEGAVLVDENGERFLLAEHRDAELAPRDVVARAIWRRLEAGHEVFLDARHAVGEAFPQRFPTVFELCRRHGFDPRTEPLPVTPAAHFHMGGVAVDRLGRTSLVGLWACGEVAGSGVHGANRLASNSLLEGMVYGGRVARDVRAAALAMPSEEAVRRAAAGIDLPAAGKPEPSAEEIEAIQQLRRLMWQKVGLVRDEAGLRQAQRQLRRLSWQLPAATSRLRNLHTVATLVTAAARQRRESRGGHYRADFPAPDATWRRRIYLANYLVNHLVDHRVNGEMEIGPLLEPEAAPDVAVSETLASSAAGSLRL